MSRCKSCGVELRWITTENGKQMPVEATEVYYQPVGTKEVFVQKFGSVVRGTSCEQGSLGARAVWKPHWGDCPGAATHRKKSEKAQLHFFR